MEELEMLIGPIGLLAKVIGIVSFLLKAWGLFMINTKLGEKYAWISWIPVLNIYALVKAGGKNAIWIFWIILGYIALIIPGIILTIIVLSGISKRTGRGGWSTAGLFFIPAIMLPVIGYKLENGDSKEKRTEKIEDNIKL